MGFKNFLEDYGPFIVKKKVNTPSRGLPIADTPISTTEDKKKKIKEHIVKTKAGYSLRSKKTGRNLGTYPTRAGAEKRERQVQYFKHQH